MLPAAVFGEKGGTIRGAFGARYPPRAGAVAARPRPPRPRDPRGARRRGSRPGAAPAPVPAAAAGEPDRGALAAASSPSSTSSCAPELRDEAAREPGTHLFLAEASATNAAEGSLTGQLSWARYAYPEPLLGISTAHAAALGVRAGDRVRVRSNWGQAELRVRLDAGLPEGVVTAPHRDPAVRALLRWRREPTVRSLDLRPDRVSLERLAPSAEVADA